MRRQALSTRDLSSTALAAFLMPRGAGLRLPISCQEMDQLGLTIEAVSRTMTRLKEGGFIALPTPHDVEFLHPAELAALAEGVA